MTEEEILKANFVRCESRRFGGSFNGIEYDSDIVSSEGCCVTLFPHEEHSVTDIKNAKIAAKNQRDVVYFQICRVPKEWYDADSHTPAASVDGGWVPAAKWITDNHSARRVIPETGELVPEKKRGGILLDAFSASVMVQVYNALNATNKAKFAAMDVRVAHHIAFGAINKAKGGA